MRILVIFSLLILLTDLGIAREFLEGTYTRCVSKTLSGVERSVQSVVTFINDGRMYDVTALVVGNNNCEITEKSIYAVDISEREIHAKREFFEIKEIKTMKVSGNQNATRDFNLKKECGRSDWKTFEERSCPVSEVADLVLIEKTNKGMRMIFPNGEKREFQLRRKTKDDDVNFLKTLVEEARP